MPQAVYILFGWLLTTAASYCLGRLLLQRLPLSLHRQERHVFAFLFGSALLSLIVFTLCALGLIYKGTILAVGLACIAAWLRFQRASELPSLPTAPKWTYPVFAVFGALMFFHAMAPEMSPDGSAYHLGFVAKYYREHGFSRITTSIYANLSQGMEMLFLFAFAFGKHSAAALTHLNFLFVLAAMVFSYGRRFGFPSAGLAASVIVFVTPVLGVDAASAYNDAAVAAVIFAVFYLAQIQDAEPSRGLAIAIGALGGFAYAIKYTAFLALPYAIGWMLWRKRWKQALLAACIAAIWIAPWMAKDAILLGNPISPFGNKLFPNPYVHVSFEEEYAVQMRHYGGIASRWDIPLEVTVRGQVLCGLLGPFFLLAPIALLAWRKPHGKRLLFAAAFFSLGFAANNGTRFLIPAIPFLALAMASALSRFPIVLALLTAAHAVSASSADGATSVKSSPGLMNRSRSAPYCLS